MKDDVSEMTEGRKNIGIKKQHRRGNGSTDKGIE
jgi:hypothetical protein